MKLLIVYTSIFLFIFYGLFINREKQIVYSPIETGLLYSLLESTGSILGVEVTERALYKRGKDDYTTIEMYSKEKLPGKFLIKLTENEDVKYRVILKPKPQKKSIVKKIKRKPIKKVTENPKKTEIKQKEIIKLTTVKKAVPEEILNINKVGKIVENSARTYFLSNIEETIDQVTVIVKSITPYQNKTILTLELLNNQEDYFFISNIAIISAGLPVKIKKYHKPFITGNNTSKIFIITRKLQHEAVRVKISEYTGKKRMFNLPIAIP